MEKLVAASTAALIIVGRVCKVTRMAKCITKGVAIGMAMGALAGAAGSYCMSSGTKRTMRRKANHAADFVSDLMDNMGYMFK